MSDTIVVMSEGRIEQIGPPEDVYNTPASEFVAQFLGASNILSGRALGIEGDELGLELAGFPRLAIPKSRAPNVEHSGPARLVIRAEKLVLEPPDSEANGRYSVPATVETVDYQGQSARYFLRVGEHQLQAINMIDERPFAQGDSVALRFRARDCAALPAGGSQ